jgi:hypothetical protein
MEGLDGYRQQGALTCSPRLSQGLTPTHTSEGAAMIYDIGMPHKEFVRAESLVKDITRRCYTRELTLITQDSDKLTEDNQEYLESDPMALGVTFMDIEAKQFSIWLSPNFKHWDSPWALDTVLHELTHGYANAMDHGQRFRRTLVKALYLYDATIAPIKANSLARQTIRRYSKDPTKTQMLEQAFAKKEALGA